MRLQLLKKTFAKVNTLKDEKRSFNNVAKIGFFLMLGIFLLLLKFALKYISRIPDNDYSKSSFELSNEGKFGTPDYYRAKERENPRYL